MIDEGDDQPFRPVRRSLSSTPNRRSQLLRSSSGRGLGFGTRSSSPSTFSSSRPQVSGFAGGYNGYGGSDPHWVTMESPTGKRAKSGNLRRMIRQSQSCNIAVESLFLNNEGEGSGSGDSSVEADKAGGGSGRRRRSKQQEEEDSLCCVLPRKPSLPFGTPLKDVNTLLALDGDDDDDEEDVSEDLNERYRPVRTPRRSRSFGIVGGGATRGGGGNLRLSLRRGLSARFNGAFRRTGSMD